MARVIVMMLLVAAAGLGSRWYQYVTNTENAYDEVGIEINSRMPEGLRLWGCDRLKEHFARQSPPKGCARPDAPWLWIPAR